jgi:predicted ATPase
VEVLTVERPLILWVEDLQWIDMSTLDWLAFVARRHEPARLLVIGTYRPVEVLAREHPLKGVKQELQLHGQCQELALDFLTEEHVAEYLPTRNLNRVWLCTAPNRPAPRCFSMGRIPECGASLSIRPSATIITLDGMSRYVMLLW